jgi:hypothetical protein
MKSEIYQTTSRTGVNQQRMADQREVNRFFIAPYGIDWWGNPPIPGLGI